jgi:hypothetical protein
MKGSLSAICSWIRRGWCSKRGSTTPTSPTATASSSYSNHPRLIVCRASPTCGWTPLYTGQERGAFSGWRRRWAGRQRLLGTRSSRLRRR